MAASLLTYTEKEALNVMLGKKGVNLISDTSDYTGNWDMIQTLSATTFATLRENIDTSMVAIEIPAGMTIYGNFIAIKLTSGKIRAYGVGAVVVPEGE